jgi:hypothetical protein
LWSPIFHGRPKKLADRKSWHRLVVQIRPGVSTQLTRRTKAKKKILKDIAGDVVHAADEAIKDAKCKGHRAGLITDGWTNMKRVGIDGVLLTLGFLVFLLPSLIGGTIHHGVAVAMMIEHLLFEAFKDQHTFFYFCCDDAGQCGKVRHILQHRHPRLLINCC